MHADDAFETLFAAAASPVLVLCDHASRRIPADFDDNDLGLHLSDLERHISHDVGALDLARIIAQRLDATVVASRFSRLLVDANRGENDPTLIMKLYDGSIIPGNRQVGPRETEERLARFHRPYHGEIRRLVEAKAAAGHVPVLVSIHSFTPQLRGRATRPWHIGVLWHGDDRLARPFMQALDRAEDICVGDNEPYSGGLPGDTLNVHGMKRGLPHVLIEFRNDLIADETGQQEWAGKILPALNAAISQVLTEENLYG